MSAYSHRQYVSGLTPRQGCLPAPPSSTPLAAILPGREFRHHGVRVHPGRDGHRWLGTAQGVRRAGAGETTAADSLAA